MTDIVTSWKTMGSEDRILTVTLHMVPGEVPPGIFIQIWDSIVVEGSRVVLVRARVAQGKSA